jgi:hypothetical protein
MFVGSVETDFFLSNSHTSLIILKKFVFLALEHYIYNVCRMMMFVILYTADCQILAVYVNLESKHIALGKSNCIMDDDTELSSLNKNKTSDDVTQAITHTASEGQFDFKNPPEIDEPLYALAMESTQVVADLLSWPDYDNTEIGRELYLIVVTPLCYHVL